MALLDNILEINGKQFMQLLMKISVRKKKTFTKSCISSYLLHIFPAMMFTKQYWFQTRRNKSPIVSGDDIFGYFRSIDISRPACSECRPRYLKWYANEDIKVRKL